MENAIKALYMGAGMLLGVMVLSVMVYMFRTGGRTSENYESQKAVEQMHAFNTKFEVYERESVQEGSGSGYAFITKGNTASDVVSCANLAFDINNKNGYDVSNSVQVIVEIGSDKYYIYPFEIVKKNKFVNGLSFNTVQAKDSSNSEIDESDYYDFYAFLRDYNNVRIVNIDSTNFKSTSESIYEYYFDVDEEGITYSEATGKVNSITFKMYETEEFDNTTYWVDNI